MFENLIYDIGLHNGDDTAFYLESGYRVVAIEADPELVNRAQARFVREIENGSLTILGVGIAEKEGTSEFWICDEVSEWNSFDRNIASRSGRRHHSIMVPTLPFRAILRRYGVPYYLKIDIEGADRLCLADLEPGSLPRYISTESECLGSEQLADATAGLASLKLLHQIGYRRFKLVDQARLASPTPLALYQMDRIGRRALRLIGHGIPIVSSLFSSMTYRGRLEHRFDRAFPIGCSGAWGEDAPGAWMTLEKANAAYVMHRRRFFRRLDATPHSFWCDWHASL